jgi:hypothetical protein
MSRIASSQPVPVVLRWKNPFDKFPILERKESLSILEWIEIL